MTSTARHAATLAALLATAVASAATAQQTELRVNPRIGVFVPMTNLGQQTAQGALENVALDNSLALGLGIELVGLGLPFGLRANLDYATEAAVTREGVDAEADRATVLAVVADLVFRPLPRLLLVQPYLFTGGGLKQYGFDRGDATGFAAGSDPTIHLGGGIDFPIGPIALNAELGNYISWFRIRDADSRMQHDLFFTLGFAVRMF